MVGATVISKKTWDSISRAGQEVVMKAAVEAGKLFKEHNRRENVESVEAMKKRGLTVHAISPQIEAEWRQAAEAFYPKIRGRLVPADICDEVAKLLKECPGRQGSNLLMNGEIPIPPEYIPRPAAEVKGWRAWLRNGESFIVSLVLAAMVILPLTEIILRKVFHTGISGASAFLQHFTLLVGLLGGALAAREGRLLSLSTLTNLLKGRWKTSARLYSSSFAAAITVFSLCGERPIPAHGKGIRQNARLRHSHLGHSVDHAAWDSAPWPCEFSNMHRITGRGGWRRWSWPERWSGWGFTRRCRRPGWSCPL